MRILPVLAAAALLGGTIGAAGAQTVRIALQDDPDSLDPAKNGTFCGRPVLASLCDKLVDLAPDGSIVPQLATEWTTAEDGRSVTFELRQVFKFHDGQTLDAASVKCTIERALTLPGSRRKSEIGAISGVEVVDPLTVRFLLEAPFSPLVAQFTDRAGIIIAPKAAAEAGDKFDQKPVCAGPYKFVERVPQDRIVLERFADYWDAGRYHFDRVTFLPISDAGIRFANLQAGQIEIIERLAPTDLEAAKADRPVRTPAITGLGDPDSPFNVRNGAASDHPFGNAKPLRQAFDLALDRNAINEVAFAGQFTSGNQPC